MKMVGFWGVRGGVGTTSMVAMASDALHRAGQSVLMIDLNSADVLRLHFNVEYTDKAGWAHAQQTKEKWDQQIVEIAERLWLLPFGRFGVPHHAMHTASQNLSWLTEITDLNTRPQWVLLDMPAQVSSHPVVNPMLDMNLMVASADMGCHILLSQQTVQTGTRLLVNMLDPSRELCNDLMLEWTALYPDVMLPIIVNRDESVHEALAMKSPVTQCFPTSFAAHDARALAAWLNLNVG